MLATDPGQGNPHTPKELWGKVITQRARVLRILYGILSQRWDPFLGMCVRHLRMENFAKRESARFAN